MGKAKGARTSAAGDVPQAPELKHPGIRTTQKNPFSHAMNPSVQANKIYDNWTEMGSCSGLDGQETRAKTSFDILHLGLRTGPRIFTGGPISSI